MSRKQFISAEEHLAKLGLTVQQALNFIVVNVNQNRPEVIYTAARESGVTNAMLREITNVSIEVIVEYFSNAELNPDELNQTSLLFNADEIKFESLLGNNENSGVLSNASLREAVSTSLVDADLINFIFLPIFEFQTFDGIYDAEELGAGHLGNVPATEESLESLFFGSLINIFSEIDESELTLIENFQDGTREEYQMLLLDTLDESSPKSTRSDEQLAELVVMEAAKTIDNFFDGDSGLVGLLDPIFHGPAIV